MVEEGRVVKSRGKGNPLRFIDMIGKVSWMAKLRRAIGDLLQKGPRTAVTFALQNWCGVHRSQTGSLSHGPQGDEYIIAASHTYFILASVAHTSNALHSKALSVMAKAEI